MENVLIERAIKDDAQDILRITRAAFTLYAKKVGNKKNIAALHETLLDVETDINNKFVYVARYNKKIVGSVRFTHIRDGIAYLSRFSVLPEVQSFGIGGLLLEFVRNKCVELGMKAIILHTASKMSSAVSFYIKNGYYIHSVSKDADYIRALMVNELTEMNELYDYESILK